MTRKPWCTLGSIVLVFATVLLGALPAAAQKPLRNRDKDGNTILIDRSGRYRLAEDLLGCTIVIAASDVRIEFDGHTLDQSPGGGLQGILVTGVGYASLVGPGTIKNFLGNSGRGIEFKNAHHCEVIGLTITNNVFGVVVDDDANTPAYDPSTDNRFISNQVTNNTQNGFDMHGAERNLLQSNNVSNNGNVGITLAVGVQNLFLGNTLSQNTHAGIQIGPEPGAPATSNNNTIQNNIATGNGFGILLSQNQFTYVSGTLVTGNTATGNGTDLMDDSPNGPCLNTWMNNTFVTEAGAVDCIN